MKRNICMKNIISMKKIICMKKIKTNFVFINIHNYIVNGLQSSTIFYSKNQRATKKSEKYVGYSFNTKIKKYTAKILNWKTSLNLGLTIKLSSCLTGILPTKRTLSIMVQHSCEWIVNKTNIRKCKGKKTFSYYKFNGIILVEIDWNLLRKQISTFIQQLNSTAFSTQIICCIIILIIFGFIYYFMITQNLKIIANFLSAIIDKSHFKFNKYIYYFNMFLISYIPI